MRKPIARWCGCSCERSCHLKNCGCSTQAWYFLPIKYHCRFGRARRLQLDLRSAARKNEIAVAVAWRWHALRNTSANCIRLGHDRATTANASQTAAMPTMCNCRLPRIPSKMKPALRYRSTAHALGILLHLNMPAWPRRRIQSNNLRQP